MLTYSIAIRTLGTGGEKFRKELQSITLQTIQPERVLIYIAEGYPRPDFTIGKEEYIGVKKGMMAQRILTYQEISSDCILMLDDDVCLAADSVERMLVAMEKYNADCVGADTFKNQDMPFQSKVYAALTNLVFPHYSKKWAFKIHGNGSFSYNAHPTKSFYWSQSCAGHASLWNKKIYQKLCLKDELWLDQLGFAYGDDVLLSYKLHKNGFRLGVVYNAGIENLDGSCSSEAYRKNPERMYVRSKASFIIWWRTCFKSGDTAFFMQYLTVACFLVKSVWLFFVMCITALVTKRPGVVWQYLKGLTEGWNFVHSDEYRNIRDYIINK